MSRQDTVGNGNEAASITVGVDLPHAIMVMEPNEDGPYNDAFEVMIMFTESVDSFTGSDITLGGTATYITLSPDGFVRLGDGCRLGVLRLI